MNNLVRAQADAEIKWKQCVVKSGGKNGANS